MRAYIKYTAITVLFLSALGCSKDRSDDRTYARETIQFAGGEVTKALLESDGLLKTHTQVKVYDFLTGFDGTINNETVTASDTYKYVDDVVEYQETTQNWPFTTVSHEYRWTKSGTHRFFGWLNKDQTYNNNAGMTTYTFFGADPTLNENTLVMTTPNYCWTMSSPQYDFLYAKQAVVRNAADGDYSDVILPMKHMFTAVSLTLENISTNTNIRITGLSTLYNGEDKFLHKGNAQVDFSANGELTPTYTLTGDETHPFFNVSGMSGISVAPGEQYDILKSSNNKLKNSDGTATGNTQEFYMTWPLTQQQISNYKLNPFGEKYYDEEDKILALSYIAGQSPEQTVRIPFPAKDWRAGTKMHMNIEFTDKAISIVGSALPWDYNDHHISFNNESLVVPNKVSIDGMTELGDNATVYITPEMPELTCRLYISSLQGATLVITKVGPDPAYFTLDPASITITGQQLSFKVKASSLSTGGVQRTCQLSYTVVLPDGREIEGDSEIRGNDHNYTFARH